MSNENVSHMTSDPMRKQNGYPEGRLKRKRVRERILDDIGYRRHAGLRGVDLLFLLVRRGLLTSRRFP